MKVLIFIILTVFVTSVSADANSTKKEDATKEALKKAMEAEKKYALEQKFYTVDEYDFKGAEVNPKSLDGIKALEPDYDFDMDEGVYDD